MERKWSVCVFEFEGGGAGVSVGEGGREGGRRARFDAMQTGYTKARCHEVSLHHKSKSIVCASIGVISALLKEGL